MSQMPVEADQNRSDLQKMQTYDKDFYQWTIEQTQALRERNLELLDWDNLIEEIESLGKSDYAKISSKVMRIIEHKLKLDYVNIPDCMKHWRHEIKIWQKDIKRHISPSMKPKLLADLDELFLDAKDLVLDEYDVELPENNPYSLDELLIDNQTVNH